MLKKGETMNKMDTEHLLDSYRHAIKNDLLDKAYSAWLKEPNDQLYIEHNKHTYWCKINNTKLNQELNKPVNEDKRIDSTGFDIDEFMAFSRYCAIAEIGNFTIKFLYFQRDSITEDSYYFSKISNSNSAIKIAISPKSLASASEFKPTTMSVLAGAIFTGETYQLNTIFKDKAQDIKSVETIPYIGYNKLWKTYVYNQYAVHNGVVYPKNKDGYFEIKNHLNIKSTLELSDFDHNIEYINNWLDDYLISFGEKGLVALAFWVGTLFVEQIRESGHPWPFLTITGKAGAGKSFLITFLWMLFGRDQAEGENPSTASEAGGSRYLVQVSNLPVVYIEGDINHPNKSGMPRQQATNFEALKPLFNGRSPRMTAPKTNDNKINSQPFKGGLVISQNEPVTGSEAIESRLVDLYFDKSHHTQDSALAVDRLSRLKTHEVSGFLFHALKHEAQAINIVEKDFIYYRNYVQSHLKEFSNSRIETTHGLILCYLHFLKILLPIPPEFIDSTQELILEMALNKVQKTEREPEDISQFWDVYEYFTDRISKRINHSKDPNCIAIYLQEFYQLAHQFNQELTDIKRLQKLLTQSVRHPFIDFKPMRSAITGKTLRCYIFKKELKNHD